MEVFNPTMRKKLAAQWLTLSPEEKVVVRAGRARRGIACPICGSIGYFRENCPNNCVSPPSSPESDDGWGGGLGRTKKKPKDDNIVGLGVLWNRTEDFNSASIDNDTKKEENDPIKSSTNSIINLNNEINDENHNKKNKKIGIRNNIKVDMNIVRPEAEKQLKIVNENDKKIGTFEFFTLAQPGYHRTYPELTLHQVLRRLMRLLEKNIQHNIDNLTATFDTTLLHPPKTSNLDTFYPKQLKNISECNDYFIKKENNIKNNNSSYKNKSSIKPVDALDPLFRGMNSDTSFLFENNSKAGHSIHSKTTWKSILAQNDELASSDPSMARKQAAVDQLFQQNAQWINMQSKDMQFTNDRFEHLVNICKSELLKEHERESKILACPLSSTGDIFKHTAEEKQVNMEIWRSRLSSVDMIMQCLKAYNFTSGNKQIMDINNNDDNSLSHTVITYNTNQNTNSNTYTTNNTNNSTNDYDNNTKNNSKKSNIKKKKVSNKENIMITAASSPYEYSLNILAQHKKQKEKWLQKIRNSSLLLNNNDNNNNNNNNNNDNNNNNNSNNNNNNNNNNIIVKNNSYESFPDVNYSVSFSNSIDGGILRIINDSNDDNNDNLHAESNDSFAISASSETISHNNNKNKSIISHSNSYNSNNNKKKKLPPRPRKLNAREQDQLDMKQAKISFIRAGLSHHIRKGVDTDLATLGPSLIPIPKAFENDNNRNTLSSYVGEQIIQDVRKSLVRTDIGYTPQRLLPLYIRNTLIETNGTSANGDQNYDVMSTDRRYNHYVGRVLNRFEPWADGGSLQSIEEKTPSLATINSNNNDNKHKNDDNNDSLFTSVNDDKSIQNSMAPLSVSFAKSIGLKKGNNVKLNTMAMFKDEDSTLSGNDDKSYNGSVISSVSSNHYNNNNNNNNNNILSEKERKAIKKEMEKAKSQPISISMARLLFRNNRPDLSDLNYIDD
eukprot:gene4935-6903_t